MENVLKDLVESDYLTENELACKFKVLYRGKLYTDYVIHSNGMIDILRKTKGDIFTTLAKLIKCTCHYDKNKKLIFEGDIVKQNCYCGELINVIFYDKYSCSLKRKFKCNDGSFDESYIDYLISEGEIIGNIYENPELLTNNKEN